MLQMKFNNNNKQAQLQLQRQQQQQQKSLPEEKIAINIMHSTFLSNAIVHRLSLYEECYHNPVHI